MRARCLSLYGYLGVAAGLALSGLIARVHADGLPGEYLVNDRWRAMLVEHSSLSNPAMLTEEDFATLRMAAAKPLNEFNLVELGFTYPIGLHQSAGLTWCGLFTDRFAETGIQQAGGAATDPFEESGRDVGDAHNLISLTYAASFWRGFSGGINVNMAHQSLFDQEQRYGVGVDVGLTYRFLNHPLLGEHIAGAGLQNLLAPKLSETEEYTRNLTLSWVGTYLEERLRSVVEVHVRDFLAEDTEFLGDKELEWDALVRLDGWLLRVVKIYGLAGLGRSGFEYGGFGAGVNVPTVNGGRDFEFLYQFLGISDGLAPSHSASVRVEMGKHREELFARRMANRLNVAPNDLYSRALALYTEKRYWDAYFLFSELVRDYPGFFKNDWVSYFRGSCLENLGLREAGDSVYTAGKRDYPRTTARPYMDLGLMRIHYRNNDRGKVEQQLRALNQAAVPDTLKFHAYYLMAQMNVADGQERTAKALLEVIPPGHPEYAFARHSLAVVNARDKDYDRAAEHLQECIQIQPTTPSEQAIVDRSYVFLGYLFYEQARDIESGLAKAVTALRLVPPTSAYRDDALLGLGWCALKARQWQDCIEAGKALVRESPRAVNRCEGRLLQAYAHIMRKEWGLAATLLEDATAVLDTLQPPKQETLTQRTTEYRTDRTGYEAIGAEMIELGAAPNTARTAEAMGDLRSRQQTVRSKLDDYMTFKDAFERTAFFARTLDDLREDVQYALARAEQVTASRGVQRVHQEIKEETADIDAEIERLQQQLEELE
ncbi:MAG: hypothetical protein GF331_16305 [Chitinivibrionales bacterium]|nr:hypothetical protein [Chitinivibrionales bacterium]